MGSSGRAGAGDRNAAPDAVPNDSLPGPGDWGESVGVIRIPLRTINPLNQREHWRQRAVRVKAERTITSWSLVRETRPDLPVAVTLTREAERAMDTDGLAASFKGVRDEVAAWLGLDDADPRVEWRYAQRKTKGFHVVIEIEPS